MSEHEAEESRKSGWEGDWVSTANVLSLSILGDHQCSHPLVFPGEGEI